MIGRGQWPITVKRSDWHPSVPLHTTTAAACFKRQASTTRPSPISPTRCDSIRNSPVHTIAAVRRTRLKASTGRQSPTLARQFVSIQECGCLCRPCMRRQSLGETDKAIADYTAAIRLDPKMASAYLGRAFAYEAKGDSDKQIDDVARPFASTRNRQSRTINAPRHTGGKRTLKRRQRIIARSYA